MGVLPVLSESDVPPEGESRSSYKPAVDFSGGIKSEGIKRSLADSTRMVNRITTLSLMVHPRLKGIVSDGEVDN